MVLFLFAPVPTKVFNLNFDHFSRVFVQLGHLKLSEQLFHYDGRFILNKVGFYPVFLVFARLIHKLKQRVNSKLLCRIKIPFIIDF